MLDIDNLYSMCDDENSVNNLDGALCLGRIGLQSRAVSQANASNITTTETTVMIAVMNKC